MRIAELVETRTVTRRSSRYSGWWSRPPFYLGAFGLVDIVVGITQMLREVGAIRPEPIELHDKARNPRLRTDTRTNGIDRTGKSPARIEPVTRAPGR